MKKIILSFLWILLCNTAIGQVSSYFQLTPDGFRTNEGSTYFVIQQDGCSAADLYNRVLLSVGRQFKSPKDVISTVVNQQISINAIYPDIVKVKGFSGMADARFIVIFEFKESRMRIIAPEILSFNNEYGAEILYICQKTKALTQTKDQSIFDYKTRNVRMTEYKATIENAFNALIHNLIYTTTNTNNDNW